MSIGGAEDFAIDVDGSVDIRVGGAREAPGGTGGGPHEMTFPDWGTMEYPAAGGKDAFTLGLVCRIWLF